MKITVIGGGNIGTLMAADMASRGNEVTVYTSKIDKWSDKIDVFDQDNKYILTGELSKVTDNLQDALYQAELIWITVPAQAFNNLAEKMLPYVTAEQIIGVVPGSGGAEFAFSKLIKKGCTLFGLQRVHSIARLKEYGSSVYMLGRKSELQLGSIPAERSKAISKIVYKLFEIPCVDLPNYLCVTLTPSNPILHTTRLFSMFKDYSSGLTYPKNFLFYEEWNDEASKMLLACDNELQMLCSKIPLELDDVVSLRVYYESNSADALTRKIKSIKAFRGISSPMVLTENNAWIPDFYSRYFTADFSFGLKIILDLCQLFDIEANNIKSVWEWYLATSPIAFDSYFSLNLTKEEFINLYK